jgi:hypothetical protein
MHWWNDPNVLLQKHPYTSTLFAVQVYLLVGVVWSLYARTLIPLVVMFVAAVLLTLMKKDNEPPLYYYHHPPQMQFNRNPMPFGDHASAVRAQVPPPQFCYHASDELERLYKPITEWPEGFRTNPLPDPTLMARQPVWAVSSEMDRNIVRDTNYLRYA